MSFTIYRRLKLANRSADSISGSRFGEPGVCDVDTKATFRAGGRHPQFGESGASHSATATPEEETDGKDFGRR